MIMILILARQVVLVVLSIVDLVNYIVIYYSNSICRYVLVLVAIAAIIVCFIFYDDA